MHGREMLSGAKDADGIDKPLAAPATDRRLTADAVTTENSMIGVDSEAAERLYNDFNQ